MINTNPWVQTNQKVIDTIKRTCIEHDLKGGYGGAVPLQHIIRLFDSAIIEINRLQKENDSLKPEIDKLKKENDFLTTEVKKYKPAKKYSHEKQASKK